jgi:hypothetical protein
MNQARRTSTKLKLQVRIYGDRRITEMKDEEYLHAVVMTKALKVDDDGTRDIVS